MIKNDPDKQRIKTLKSNIKNLKKERNEANKRVVQLDGEIRHGKKEIFHNKMTLNKRRRDMMIQQLPRDFNKTQEQKQMQKQRWGQRGTRGNNRR